MSRRSTTSSGPSGSPRARGSPGGSSSGTSTSGGQVAPSSPSHSPAVTTATQFLSLRSRVGKRFQAVIPELITDRKHAVGGLEASAKALYSLDRAEALGPALDKYLAFARSLRDGSTFDTVEQVNSLALQYLHRFDYNTTDAACSLYARHSIELPRSAITHPTEDGNPSSTRSSTTATAADARKWVSDFYQSLRRGAIDVTELSTLRSLVDQAKLLGDLAPSTEVGVLQRLVARISDWQDACARVAGEQATRPQLLQLVYEAENMQVVLPEKSALLARIDEFDQAYLKIKEMLERSSKRSNQKAALATLEDMYNEVIKPKVLFEEQSFISSVVEEGRQLKSVIDAMLAEDKVSLPAMRELLAKMESAPIDFETEVTQFQEKMLSAQNWLAKVRKCMPKRRQTRRRGVGAGGVGASGAGDAEANKKMDLDTIRALVDDAPCDDSSEMFEMQDLLDCADEWAEKVRQAIDANAADVTLEYLKELMAEGSEIPIEMEELTFLEAEIAAREWCTTATEMLANRCPVEDMEILLNRAKEIRLLFHPRKQSRWKPQVERDINAAMDVARRWVNETKDALGSVAFDRIFSGLMPKSEQAIPRGDKKSIDTIKKLVEKAERLLVDMSSYTKVLLELIELGEKTREQARAVLNSIGYTNAESDSASGEQDGFNNDKNLADAHVVGPTPSTSRTTNGRVQVSFAQASAVLERVDSLPFSIEEGDALGNIIDTEKQWAQRVRECVPPRQSRKKRQANQPFTESNLRELVEESKKLYFTFPEELRIASKELADLNTWRVKARSALDGRVSEEIALVVEQLEKIDIDIYEKVQAAKRKIQRSDDDDQATTGDVKLEGSTTGASPDADMIDAANDITTADSSSLGETQGNPEEAVKEDENPSSDALGMYSEMLVAMKTGQTGNIESALNVRAIMAHVRLESGSKQKSSKDEDSDIDIKNEEESCKSEAPAARDLSMLQSILDMVESSLTAVSDLELKEETRQTVEEMVIADDAKTDVSGESQAAGDKTVAKRTSKDIASVDDAVRVLESWREHLSHTLDECDLLSVVPPEQRVVSLVVELLDWLQSARSIFYLEPLPLSQLVARGKKLQEGIKRIDPSILENDTFTTLTRMLWPQSYLEAHERVVAEWNERVQAALKRKHVLAEELQSMLDEGNALLLEPSDFKQLLDEAKRAKMWLLKVKKRAKGLLSKQQARMTLAVARALVEEGDSLALELPAYDYLKEHFDTAVDWEERVLSSGLESGQARIANLLALLNEYECARLVIDLDMHREVLTSATERFCICRQPFDGLMIGCDYCDDWFHDNCIGMSKEKAEKVEHYTCPSCTILQELQIQLEKAKEDQDTRRRRVQEDAGKDPEHEANLRVLDRQRVAAIRKIKREERAIERNEMLLFSASNHLTQLQTRISEIERLTAGLPQSKDALKQSQGTGFVPLAASVSAGVIQSRIDPSQALTASISKVQQATVVQPAPSGIPALPAVPSTIAANGMASLPSILLPRSGALPAASDGSNLASTKVSVSPTSNGNISAAGSTSSSSSKGSSSESATISSQAQSGNTESVGSAVAGASPEHTDNALKTIPASVPNNTTQRLSTLVAASGIEQQLIAMRTAQAEHKKQVDELQSSLSLSRARRDGALTSLTAATSGYNARRDLYPASRKWIRDAVSLLNATSLVTRSTLQTESNGETTEHPQFLIPEYAAAIEKATKSNTTSDGEKNTMGLAELFPDVMQYVRILRAVCWSVVVVAMLQERPSHDALSNAIAYASNHALWNGVKTIMPLRHVLGRLDAWVARAHKSVTKSSGTASAQQRVTRLKQLLNEYSKLPLTWQVVASPLEAYIKLLERSLQASADPRTTHEELQSGESAAVAALDDAMRSAVSSVNGTASASVNSETADAAASAPKPARKRKSYVRKDKDKGKEKEKAPGATSASSAPPARKRPRAKKSASEASDRDAAMVEQR